MPTATNTNTTLARFSAASIIAGMTVPVLADATAAAIEADRKAARIALREFWRTTTSKRVSLRKEALHPETRNGATGRNHDRSQLRQLGEPEPERFTADTAKKTGQILVAGPIRPRMKHPTQQQTKGWEPIPEVETPRATAGVCGLGNSYPPRAELYDLLARTVIFLLRVGSDWEHRSIKERAPYLIQAHRLQTVLVRANWNADKACRQPGLSDSPWLGSTGEKAPASNLDAGRV